MVFRFVSVQFSSVQFGFGPMLSPRLMFEMACRNNINGLRSKTCILQWEIKCLMLAWWVNTLWLKTYIVK